MSETRTKELLHQFDIGPQYRGFHYFLSGVEILQQHPDYLKSITKCLYPEIAKMYGTSIVCVERNIRTIIEIMWRNGCDELFEQTFQPITNLSFSEKRPSNTQFFQLLLAYMETATAIPDASYNYGSCKNCRKVASLNEKILSLEHENQWMHDLIWELVRKSKR